MKTYQNSRWRHLLAATLAIGGAWSAIAPVFATGTASGTAIRNTATATYKDSSNTDYNATSNTVEITVAEVAGVTVVAQTPSNLSPNAGDTIYVDFVITNVGNDPTQIFIPGSATISGSAFTQNGPLQIIAVDGTTLGAPVNIPQPVVGVTPGGATTGTLSGLPNSGSLPANPGTGTTGTITVRVPLLVSSTAVAGNNTTVTLGNSTPLQTSQPQAGTITGDVYTVDNPNGVGGETNTTTPAVRESADTSATITVNARLQSFATVLKAVGNYTNTNTPDVLTDDVLTYRLALRVENPAAPPTGLVTSDLYGTQLNVNTSTAKSYVLVSDAVPAGMQFTASNTATATAPGWTPVYTDSPLTVAANNAQWSTTLPSGTVTRVGFIYDQQPAGAPSITPISKGAVNVGNTITGFSFTVTPKSGFTGGEVANIAQVLGQSQPGAVVAGTATQIVYDESGDQTSNNGLNGTTPTITTGVANPAVDGRDPGTGSDPTIATGTTATNTGTPGDTGGEDTVYTIAATPMNGPDSNPKAVGPTNTNDDFTNKSIQPPDNLDPATSLTDGGTPATDQTPPVTFTNTVQNTSGDPQPITLLPTPPATPSALPDGTKVTITNPATSMSASYTYTAAGGFAPAPGTTSPISITIPGNDTANYTVTVDLPGAAQLTGFPVPITAFVDVNKDGLPTNEPSNITIDRLYTGYVRLLKEARLLETDGATPVAGSAGVFSTNQADLSAAATPGRVIEYRISYSNISTGNGSGSNNVILPANNLTITEDGTAGTNNWFVSTTDPKYPTQANGSASDNNGGTISVTTTAGPSNIQIYTDTIATVAPGASGTFTFQRKIN